MDFFPTMAPNSVVIDAEFHRISSASIADNSRCSIFHSRGRRGNSLHLKAKGLKWRERPYLGKVCQERGKTDSHCSGYTSFSCCESWHKTLRRGLEI